MIELNKVTKLYHEKGRSVGISDCSLTINDGEFVFLVGQSGAGKTTLVKLLIRELKPDNGEIFVNNYNVKELKHNEIPFYRRKLGLVFQDYKLLPNKTVYENIAFALQVTDCPQNEIRPKVEEAIKQVGLSGKENLYPNQLSGGEQQRIAIGRAIVNKPEIIIADEPTGNLDPKTSSEIVNLLLQINKTHSSTIIMATHDKAIVDATNKRVIALSDGIVISDKRGGYVQ